MKALALIASFGVGVLGCSGGVTASLDAGSSQPSEPCGQGGCDAGAEAAAPPLAPADAASDGLAYDPNDVIWQSDFETGDLSEWSQVQACPNGVTVVTSPTRHGGHAARFAVADDDTHAKCFWVPTENPRAQLVGPVGLFKPGEDVYVGFSTFFPADFPTLPTDYWMQVNEQYGPPFNGSPTMEITVFSDRLSMQSQQADGYHWIWIASEPLHKGTAWEDIVLHINWSTDPKVGFVELWYDGVQQTFSDGQTREDLATVIPSVNGLLDTVFVNQYRKAGGSFGTIVLYHDDVRVGRTYASVAR